MSSKMQKNPSIRFKGFTDAWEQRKSHEIFQTITDYVANGSFASLRENVSYSKKKDFAIVVRLTDYSNKYKGPFLYTSELGYKFLKKSSLVKGDILISNVGANAGLVYRAPNMDVPMTLGPNSILVRSDGNDTEFLYQMMKTTYGEKKIKEQIGISAQPKFNKTEFRQIDFFLPSNDEQKQIGTMFSQLDKTIALHQRQLDNFKELKKAMLQKIFNQELRFKDDDGNEFPKWEIKKASEIFNPYSEKNASHLPILSATQDRGLVYRDEVGIDIKYDENSLHNYKIVRVNDFVISLRSFQGGFELSDKQGIVSPAYTIFSKIDKEIHEIYFKHLFKTEHFINRLNTLVYGIRDGKSISFKEFSELKLSAPCYKEQQRIGNFLSLLDNRIDKEAEKIHWLNEQKKWFMQQMFV